MNLFGQSWIVRERNNEGGWLHGSDLRHIIDEKPGIAALSSHSSHLVWPDLSPDYVPIVFLRHPIDRVLSVYNFARYDASQPDHIHASTGTLRDYVDWALKSNDGGSVIRNYQVTHLSEAAIRVGHPWEAQPNHADLRHAEHLLQTWPAFGLVRHFHDSIAQYQTSYPTIFPASSFNPVHENATNHPASNETATIECVRETVGDSLYEAICEANALDIHLYETASTIFNSRIASPSRG